MKTKSVDGNATVLMTMDHDKVEAAPPYQAFVDREIQRRARRSVENIVILHAGDAPSQGELHTLLNYAESTLAIDTTGVPVRVKAFGIPPEHITTDFGMTALVAMQSEGEITDGAASRAEVIDVAADGKPRVIIVVYKQAL